jgi:transcriptional regulator with XRE-family HTH domain
MKSQTYQISDEENDASVFAKRISSILNKKEVNARVFADRIGRSQSSMSNVMNGKNKPSCDMLEGIASQFPDINLRWLITGEGEMCHTSPESSLAEQEPTLPFKDAETIENRVVKNPVKGNIPDTPLPVSSSESSFIPPVQAGPGRKVKRIILFFDDGSFEDYHGEQPQ